MFTGPEIEAVFTELKITHVVWVPDTTLGPWEESLAMSSRLRLIRVCREGEAWPLAAGLHLGGQLPLVVMQTTGLFESGDALRNVLFDLKLPIYALIGVRNWLVPASCDTAKTFAEPILRAWNLDCQWIAAPADKPKFADHFRRCQTARIPGAALLAEGAPVMSTFQANVMPVVDALTVLAERCGDDQIVVTNQGSARIWPKLRRRRLDFHYNPSTMSGAIPLALGLALSQPRREVLAISGDGSLLMSLGSLVTVVGSGAPNLTVVLLNNGVYEVTGGQQLPGAHTVDYVSLARAVGFATAVELHNLADWRDRAAETLAMPGPRFVSLAVSAAAPEFLAGSTPPMDQQLTSLRQALRIVPSLGSADL